ncbi:hypothetical protein [Flavobacterium pectinovorum]|uniref:Uncharacterized protein n=1 Tax=Flavobacterium pectinovorum TaxID=29533 RepID=A0AB36P1R1_9FLAO|nr:hypothetical protein [Flavobacterium pectinovorum]OXB04998.1 hypothetical protein B0A72_11005 [Flavobacterium pectinovorum]SHL31894.1 hypothetical protein SAMN05444387_0309 [Flavobacterium pectinovorum]
MHIVNSFEELKKVVGYSFKYDKNKSKIVGLLFAQPDSFTQDEILKKVDYYNNRSKETIDFFCVGHQPQMFEPNLPVVTIVDGENWTFNSKTFNQLRIQTEEVTNWEYSGSVELVLFNAYLEDSNDKVKLDFSDAISIDLVQAKNEELINSVSEIFERIFKIAETITTDNPTKEMSIKLIGNTGKKSFVNILFNLLPEVIRKDTKKIYLYGTSNYDK